MRRGTKGASALLALTVSVGLMVATATPASAGLASRLCSTGGEVFGASNSSTVQSAASGNCGTVGVRGYYTHVGGASWTTWTYKSGSNAVAKRTGTNFTKANHSGAGTGVFTTYV
jgi:hypothetical protein